MHKDCPLLLWALNEKATAINEAIKVLVIILSINMNCIILFSRLIFILHEVMYDKLKKNCFIHLCTPILTYVIHLITFY